MTSSLYKIRSDPFVWFLLHVSLTTLILETYYGDFISRVRVRVRVMVRYKSYLHNISELIREGEDPFVE